MPREKKSEDLQIMLIGASGVGAKSSFMEFLTTGKFHESFISTVGVDFRVIEKEIQGIPRKIKVWDFAGQERFMEGTEEYFTFANACIVGV